MWARHGSAVALASGMAAGTRQPRRPPVIIVLLNTSLLLRDIAIVVDVAYGRQTGHPHRFGLE